MPYLFSYYKLSLESDTINFPPSSLVSWFKTVQLSVEFPISAKIAEQGQGPLHIPRKCDAIPQFTTDGGSWRLFV